jgi:hypothetical protein
MILGDRKKGEREKSGKCKKLRKRESEKNPLA